MAYAVELFFASEESEMIRELWSRIKGEAISSYMSDCGAQPHLSLAVYGDLPMECFIPKFKEFVKGLASFTIEFEAISNFIGEYCVSFLAAKETEILKAIHHEYCECFAAFDEQLSVHYKPENWKPHCTLAMDIDKTNVGKVRSICADVIFPFRVDIVEIGIVEFRPVRRVFTGKLDTVVQSEKR